MEVRIEIGELVRQNVGIGDDVEVVFPELLLHLYDVVAESVLAGELVGLREVVDFLGLGQPLVLAQLEGQASPENVPVVVALRL